MARWSALARVGLRENFGEFELLALERWVAFQNLLFGRALFEHTRDFIDTNSGSANARLATPDLWISTTIVLPFKTLQSGTDFFENQLEIEQKTASEHRQFLLGRFLTSPIYDDRHREAYLCPHW